MDQDIFASQWKQMRGTLKSWWGKLADDDFERIGGQKDKLISWVQDHYGQTHDQAQYEVERHMKEYGNTKGDCAGYGVSDTPKTAAGLTAKAQELGAAAIMGTASKTGAAASALGREGEWASPYWKEKGYKNLATDLTALVRCYPVQALLVGVGLGYVLARNTRG